MGGFHSEMMGIMQQSFLAASTYWHYALFGALAHHLYVALVQMNVFFLEIDKFRESQARVQEECHNSCISGTESRNFVDVAQYKSYLFRVEGFDDYLCCLR